MQHFQYYITFGVLLMSACANQQNEERLSLHKHPIDFAPRTYLSYHVDEPLVIDGSLDDKSWQKAVWTDSFVDIEGSLKPAPEFETKVKMLWDSDYFYVAAEIQEPHIWATLHQRDTVVFYDDDFEIFIDPDGDTHNYYEIEINALNTVWDLLLLRPYREDQEPKVLDAWDIKGLKSAISIVGSLNDPSDTDQYWSLELAIPWTDLEEMASNGKRPQDGDQWRINFSRVDWQMEVADGKYRKQKNTDGKVIAERNWVWSPQGYVAMHQPETWGYVQFSDRAVQESNEIDFTLPSKEKIKWSLRNLYFQQRKYDEEHGRYLADVTRLSWLDSGISGYSPALKIENYRDGYILCANGIEGSGEICIRQDGKVWSRH